MAFAGHTAAIFLLPLPQQASCGCLSSSCGSPAPSPSPPSSPPGDDEVIYVDVPENGRKINNGSVRGRKGTKIIRRRRRRVA